MGKRLSTYEEFAQAARAKGVFGVQERICTARGVRLRDAFYRGRTKSIGEARHICWAELSRRGWSTTEIGDLWGRHHTTIIAGRKKVSVPDDLGEAWVGPRVLDDLETRVASLEKVVAALRKALG